MNLKKLHNGSKNEKSNCAHREALGLGKGSRENFTYFLIDAIEAYCLVD